MEKEYSRRTFLKKCVISVGAATVFTYSLPDALADSINREGDIMPHISVKMYPGRSEEDKERLADAIVRDVMKYTGSGAGSISVSIEEVDPSDWKEEVYDPEIKAKADKLYKKPGYSM